MTKMKIVYLNSPFDASDYNFSFGVGWILVNQFRKFGIEVELVGPYNEKFVFFNKVRQKITPILTGKKYFRARDINILKEISNSINRDLENIDYDAIFSYGTLLVSELKSTKPIIIFTDAIFESLKDFYKDYSNLTASNQRDSRIIEERAFAKASKVIFTSQWAKDEMLKFYNFKADDISVAPFGPLIEIKHTKEEVFKNIENKKFDKIRLLFLGADWERKGGDYAYQLTKEITQKGYQCELNVVGIPQEIVKSDDILINHGYLKKSIPEQYEKFMDIIRNAHFIVLPTRADTFGIVFCESNSYGLPAIASKVGGVPEAVINGKNGFVYDFPEETTIAAETIISYFKNKEKYDALCKSSYSEYENRLNWDYAIKIIIKEIEKAVNKQ